MTLKSIATVAAIAALMTTSAAMAQTLSVDLVRNGSGFAQLTANGDWIWEVTYNTDADGGAASVSFGAEFGDADVISGAVNATGEGNGGVEQAVPADGIFGWETPSGGVGGAFPVGLQVDPSQGTNGQAFYAYGTGDLAGASSLVLGAFTTAGPSTTGSLTSSINIVSGLVGESDGSTSGLTASGSATAYPGDANLNGTTDISDVGILFPVFNTAVTGGWAQGDFNGDGLTNISDVGVMFPVFNTSQPGGAPVSSTPEPTSIALLSGLLCFAFRRRR